MLRNFKVVDSRLKHSGMTISPDVSFPRKRESNLNIMKNFFCRGGIYDAHRGFTLIEVVMAVAIVGIIATVVYGSLWGVMRTINHAREKMELCQTARCILWRMSEEIGSCFINERNSFRGCDAKSNNYDGDSMSFRSISVMNQKGISEIEYYLDEETLCKSVDGRISPIVKSVDDFNLCYFDGLEWRENWDSSLEGRLPKMIGISLWLESEPFSINVSVPVTKEYETGLEVDD